MSTNGHAQQNEQTVVNLEVSGRLTDYVDTLAVEAILGNTTVRRRGVYQLPRPVRPSQHRFLVAERHIGVEPERGLFEVSQLSLTDSVFENGKRYALSAHTTHFVDTHREIVGISTRSPGTIAQEIMLGRVVGLLDTLDQIIPILKPTPSTEQARENMRDPIGTLASLGPQTLQRTGRSDRVTVQSFDLLPFRFLRISEQGRIINVMTPWVKTKVDSAERAYECKLQGIDLTHSKPILFASRVLAIGSRENGLESLGTHNMPLEGLEQQIKFMRQLILSLQLVRSQDILKQDIPIPGFSTSSKLD